MMIFTVKNTTTNSVGVKTSSNIPQKISQSHDMVTALGI